MSGGIGVLEQHLGQLPNARGLRQFRVRRSSAAWDHRNPHS